MKLGKSFFIVGTDTDVGKTYLSALLYKALSKKNFGYYKPVQSGCHFQADRLVAPDPEFVCSFSSIPYDEEMCTYKLQAALSPHLAASLENTEIESDVIKNIFEQKLKNFSSLIVEGAGGIFVPMAKDKFFQYELIKELQLPVLIVASTKVGTINHTLLTVKFLESQGIEILGIAFNRYSGEKYEDDNIEIIKTVSGINNVFTVRENQTELEEEVLKKCIN